MTRLRPGGAAAGRAGGAVRGLPLLRARAARRRRRIGRGARRAGADRRQCAALPAARQSRLARSLQAADDGNATIAALARHLEDATAGPVRLAGAGRGLQRHRPICAGAARLRARQSPTTGGNAAALAGMGEAMLLSGDAAQRGAGGRSSSSARCSSIRRRPRRCSTARSLPIARAGWTWRASALRRMLALSPPENVRAALQKEIDEIDAKLHPAGRCGHRDSSARHAGAGAGRQGAGECLAVCVRARRRTAGRRWPPSAVRRACRRTWICRRPTR